MEFLVFLFLKLIYLNNQYMQRTIYYLFAKFHSHRALAGFQRNVSEINETNNAKRRLITSLQKEIHVLPV
jgi:hypothetical protein